MLSEAKHLLFAESGAGHAISIGLVKEARSLPVEEGRGAGRKGVRAALCKIAADVVLLRDAHRIRVVRLGVVAHPESTCLELRFDLCFGETVVITAVCHMVAGFQGLRAPAS
jgi:hypothetical protein